MSYVPPRQLVEAVNEYLRLHLAELMEEAERDCLDRSNVSSDAQKRRA